MLRPDVNRSTRRARHRRQLALRLFEPRIRFDKTMETVWTAISCNRKVCVLVDVRHAGAFRGPVCPAILDNTEGVDPQVAVCSQLIDSVPTGGVLSYGFCNLRVMVIASLYNVGRMLTRNQRRMKSIFSIRI
jgi:hypothetical protein